MFNKGVDRMRRLVCEYYDGFSFGKFVEDVPAPEGKVTDLLIGDLFDDQRGRGVGAAGVALPAGQEGRARGTPGPPDDVPDKVNELFLPEGELR